MLNSQYGFFDFLSVDDRFVESSSILIGSYDLVVDLERNRCVVEDQIFGHDSQYSIQTNKLELLCLLVFIQVGTFLAIY